MYLYTARGPENYCPGGSGTTVIQTSPALPATNDKDSNRLLFNKDEDIKPEFMLAIEDIIKIYRKYF
jgi:hypothetical protein